MPWDAAFQLVSTVQILEHNHNLHSSTYSRLTASRSSCRVLRYAVPQEDYHDSCVGHKALRLLELRRLLQPAGLEVENSVSLPFGAVKQLLEGHYENAAQCRHASKVQQSIDELMDDHGAGSEGAATQSEKVNRQLFEARCGTRTRP